jgi:membrane protease YdiL (CAAX protease family)
MTEIEEIRKDIVEIKERNARVEEDKAWETSLARKVLIAILTYIVIVIFFYFAGLPKPFVNAIVPTLGFVLSTLSIPLFRKWWVNSRKIK